MGKSLWMMSVCGEEPVVQSEANTHTNIHNSVAYRTVCGFILLS